MVKLCGRFAARCFFLSVIFSAALAGGILALPKSAGADDECGTGATASDGLTRFAQYSSTDHSSYNVGDIVRYMASDNVERVYRATGTVSGAPGASSGQNGWSAPLGATEYASKEVVCDAADLPASTPPYDAIIDYDDDNLAIIYRRSGTAESIRHTGAGGEIHLLSGSVLKPNNSNNGAALSVITTSADTIRIVTASGTSVSTADTDTGSHAIHASGAGLVVMRIAGSSSAVASNSAAILAESSLAGGNAIDVDITGGTHSTMTGSQSGPWSVVYLNASSSSGSASLKIGASATIGRSGALRRGAIRIRSFTGTTTSINNAGTIYGFISLARGADSFTNSGVFVGNFVTRVGSDTITNTSTGTMTLISSPDFGTESDSFTNEGTLVFDHAANGSRQMGLAGLETFRQTSGTIRFVYDFNRNIPAITPGSAFLNLGGTTATFTEGAIEVAPAGTSVFPSVRGVFLPLITQTRGLTEEQVRNLTSPHGALSIQNGVLRIRLTPMLCGSPFTRRPSGSTPSQQVECATPVSRGVHTSESDLLLTYDLAGPAHSPYITLTGANTEIQIRENARITRPAGTQALSAISGALATVSNARRSSVSGFTTPRGSSAKITVASGATITNMETGQNVSTQAYGILAVAREANADIQNAGTISTAGPNAYGIHAITLQDRGRGVGGSTGDVFLTTSGSITTTGDGAIGVSARNEVSVRPNRDGTESGNVTVRITGGMITTSGDMGTGLSPPGEDSSTFTAGAYGVYAAGNAAGVSKIEMQDGTVMTSGAAAIGIAALRSHIAGLTAPRNAMDRDVDIDVIGGMIKTMGAMGASGGSTTSMRLRGAYGIYGATSSADDVDIFVSGATITTGGGMVMNSGLEAHGILGFAYDGADGGTSGGNVKITVGSSASITTQGASAHGVLGMTGAVAGVASTIASPLMFNGAGSVDININGGSIQVSGTGSDGVHGRAHSGAVDIDIRGSGTRISASGERASAVRLFANQNGALALDIGSGAIVCAGAFNSGACVPTATSGLTAISLMRGSTATAQAAATINNAGSVYGDFVGSAGADNFTNSGVFRGSLANMGFGDDSVINTATGQNAMTITNNSNFGGGNNDSFTNRGALTIDAAARIASISEWTMPAQGSSNNYMRSNSFRVGNEIFVVDSSISNDDLTALNMLPTPPTTETAGISQTSAISFTGLETFTQESGSLRFRLDLGSALPTSALLNLDSASAVFTSGVVLIEHSGSGAPTQESKIPLISRTGGLMASQIGMLSSPHGRLLVEDNILKLELQLVCGKLSETRARVMPGSATRQVLCDSSTANAYSSGISASASASSLAILYDASATGTSFIRHTGSGGEIHIMQGTIAKPADNTVGAAVSVITAMADAIAITTASGTSVSNEDTDAGNHGIHASGGGDVSMAIAGSTSAQGASDAIRANATGASAIDIDIDGGTHTTTGAQTDTGGSESAIVNLIGGSGAITLDIASGATVQVKDSARRAIRVSSSNAAATTMRGVGSGSWTGNRITNRGMITGDFLSGAGDDLFENASGATFIGAFEMGAGDNEILNEGTLTLDGASVFGDGTSDALINQGSGILVIDAAAAIAGFAEWSAPGPGATNAYENGELFRVGNLLLEVTAEEGSQALTDLNALGVAPAANTSGVSAVNAIELTELDSFTMTSGILRFVFDFSHNAPLPVSASAALLYLDEATATFTAGTIEIVAASSSTFPSSGGVIPLIGHGSGLSGVGGLTSPHGALSIVNGVLQIALFSLHCSGNRSGMVSSPADGIASLRVTCDDILTAGISESADNLAILYTAGVNTGMATPFIRHTGAGGEIHIRSGSDPITKLSTLADGAAVSVITGDADAIAITTASGTNVSNADADRRNHAIHASGGGAVNMDIAGSTLAQRLGNAIRAEATGASAIEIDIDGGTHTTTGTQSADSPIVNLIGVSGAITLDIASEATVGSDSALTRRAVRLSTTGATTTRNEGSLYGVFVGGEGADSFTNSLTFSGSFSLGGENDVITNAAAGTMTLTASSDFGGGTSDRFENRGILVIDHDGAGDAQISLTSLQSFTQTSGTLRFRLDLSGSLPTTALLALGGASATFTAGAIDIAPTAGMLPTSGTLILISATTLDGDTDINGLSLAAGLFGELTISDNALRFTFAASSATYCGGNMSFRERTAIAPGTSFFQTVCDDIVTAGIEVSEDNLALLYTAAVNAGTATPFIRHTGAGGEVHIRSGSDPIAQTAGTDGAAVSVINAGADAIAITTVSGTSVSNEDTDNFDSHAIHASGGGSVSLDIAGSAETEGEDAHAVFATTTGAGIVDIDVSGMLTTSGVGADALRGQAASASSADVDIDIAGATIETTGDEAAAINASVSGGTGDITLDIAGSARITAEGSFSDAIAASARALAPSRTAPPGTTSDSGDVAITIAGDARIEATGQGSHAIYAEAWGGDIDLSITGVATIASDLGHGIYLRDRSASYVSSTSRTVSLSLGASAGARLSSDGSGTSAIYLQGDTGSSQLSVIVGLGNFVCAGSFLVGIDNCESSDEKAVLFSRRSSLSSYGGSGTYAAVLTNAGTIVGNIESSGPSGTAFRTDIMNSGVLMGSLTLGGGNDRVVNARSGTMSLTASSDFGGGASDSFENQGILVIDHDAAGDARIALSNLESFTQVSGTLRFRLDLSGNLPTMALLDTGGATPSFTAGAIDIAPSAGTLPTSGMLSLVSANSLPDGTDISKLSLAAGVFGRLEISGNALRLTFAASGTTYCGDNLSFRGRTAISPGTSTFQVVCDEIRTGGISESETGLALLYEAAADTGTATPFIRHTGAGGEIHIRSDSDPIAKPADNMDGAAVSVINAGADAIAITTASGTSIANEDTDANNHAIHASGGGNISMDIAGSTSARGASDAIRANATGSSAIDIDIDGGTHRTMGTQGSSSAVVNLIGESGTIALDIAAGATVGSDSALGRRAVRLSTKGATTTSNEGSLYGVFMGSAGADSFTNSMTFSGSFSLGGGNDAITNAAAGTMSLTADSYFGGGASDSFENRGTLVIDHDAAGDGQISLSDLESFTQTSGTLRFHIDLGGGRTVSSFAGALLDVGRATLVFTAGMVEIDRSAGTTLPTLGTLALVSANSLPDGTDISGLSLAADIFGELTVGGNALRLTFAESNTTYCGDNLSFRERAAIAPGTSDFQVVCDDIQTSGITMSVENLAILYAAAADTGTVTPFIRHTGAGGEIHIRAGSDPIAKTTGADGAAVSVIPSSGTDAIAITTASGTSIANEDTGTGDHAIHASGGGSVSVDIAGSAESEGDEAHAVFATTTGAGTVDIDVSGTITASGDDAYALYGEASSGSSADIDIDIDGATITTTGDSDSDAAYGVNAVVNDGTGGIMVDIAGSAQITTSGADSDAIRASATSSVPLGSSGDVAITITGDARIEAAGQRSPAISAEARGGDVSVSITGAATIASTHGHGIYAQDRSWANNSTASRTVSVSLGSSAGAHLSSGGSGMNAIYLQGDTAYSQLSVSVGSRNFVCAGSFSAGTDNCEASSATKGVVFSRGSGLSSYEGDGDYAAVLTNAGTIIGAVESSGPSNTAFRTDIMNSGVLTGSLTLGGGADRVMNSGVLTGSLTLGGGDNSVMNSGVLTGSLTLGGGSDMVMNSGSLTGSLTLGGGADSVMNSGSLTGSLTLGGGDDTVTNASAGTLTLTATSDFGGGSDSFENRGILVIDHDGAGDARINLSGLETFTQTSGTLRFRIDLGGGRTLSSFGSSALLDTGAATPVFTAGAIDIALSAGRLPTSGTLTLISANDLPDGTDTSNLSLAAGLFGDFEISGNALLLRLSASSETYCGGNAPFKAAPAARSATSTFQVACDDIRVLGISESETGLALLYEAAVDDTETMVTPFIRHTGAGGEIHIRSGSDPIVKPNDGEDGAAVSVITTSTEPIAITTASGTSVSNMDDAFLGTGVHAIHASGGGSVSVDIAGSVSVEAEGEPFHAVYAQTTGAGTVDIDVSGTITASGDDSHALYGLASIDSSADIDIDIDGATITATGDFAYAVNAAIQGGMGDITVDIAGSPRITTSGTDSDAIGASARSTLPQNPSPGTISDSGDVAITITGAARIEATGQGTPRAIFAEARGGDVSVSITGAATVASTRGRGIFARDTSWVNNSTTARAVSVSLGSSAGARISSGGSGTSAIYVQGASAYSKLSVSVGAGNFVCGGSFSAETGNCEASAATRGVVFFRGSRLSSYGGVGTYAAVLTNAGTIIGSVQSLGPSNTAFRTDIMNSGVLAGSLTLGDGSDRAMNSGVLTGSLTLGGGDDRVVNASSGTLTLTANSDFGGGSGDSLENRGILVIDHDANNDARISFFNLESFTQTSGTLRFRIDLGEGRTLDSFALSLLGTRRTTLVFKSGVIDIEPTAGRLPTSGTLALLSAGSLPDDTDISGLTLASGVFGTLSVSDRALRLTFAASNTNYCGVNLPFRGMSATAPGTSTFQVVCDDILTEGISESEAGLALLYAAADAATVTPFIRHTGAGGEIHIRAASDPITKSSTLADGAAVSVINAGANAIAITTASDTSVSNEDAGAGNHAIHASGGGNVSMAVAGSTSAQGASDAIRAEATGSSAIDIDIDGGTHATTGTQGSSSAVVNLIGVAGTIALDIASGAIVGSDSALTRRAVRLSTMGATTTTNAGSLYGVFMGGAGADSFTNSGVFSGRFSLGDRNDAVVNTATGSNRMTLTASSDFGDGTSDSFENRGILVIDHDGAGNAQIALSNLESFTQTSGTLRFRIDLGSGRMLRDFPNALLALGGANSITFTAGAIDIEPTAGRLPTSGTLDLISAMSLPANTDIDGLSLARGVFGELTIGGNALLLTFAASSTPYCGGNLSFRGRTAIAPGTSTFQVVCDNIRTGGIAESEAGLGLLYTAAEDETMATPFIRHTGGGGEIHIRSGSDPITKPTGMDGAAVSVINISADAIAITTASGTSIANEDTDANNHAIHASGGGNISMDIAGSTSAQGMMSDAIRANATGSSAIDIDIDGGTHRTTGTQGSSSAVVNLIGGSGTITLDIAAGAVVGSDSALGWARRAVRLSTTGATTTSNAGSLYGVFMGGAGADSFTNSLTFSGSLSLGGENDVITNAAAGTMRLTATSDFGGGMSDSFENRGILVIDHDGAGDAQIVLSNLETFTQTSGTLRFRIDLGGDRTLTSFTSALLDTGGATPSFTAGMIDIEPTAGRLPTSGTLILISATSLPDDTDISELSFARGVFGTLEISGNALRLTFMASSTPYCGNNGDNFAFRGTSAVAPGTSTFHVICDDIRTGGIAESETGLALLYTAAVNETMVTPFIRHTGQGGEIHIRSGSDPITKPAGTDGAAVSVITAMADAIAITTASGTSVSNEDTEANNHAIHASGGGAVNMDIAGSTSAQGMSDAIRAEATGNSAIDIDIDGGTHTTTGAQGSSSAIVNLIGETGTITLDIASGATVGASSALTRRAVRLSTTTGATTTTNAGSLYGVFMGGAGADSFTNSLTFSGSFSPGGGNDVITNASAGTMTLTANSDFGAGNADSLINQGTLVIDHAAEGGTVSISGLETFTQTSGVLRFRLDLSGSLPTTALLALGGATSITFTAGAIDITPSAGGTLPTSGMLSLVSANSLPDNTDISGLSLAADVFGELTISDNALRFTFAASDTTYGGDNFAFSERTAISPGTSTLQVSLDDIRMGGIDVDETGLALLYEAAADAEATPFIRHTGAGGEIHIRSGSDPIAKPAGTDGAAVSVINAGADAIAITTASGTSVSNEDMDAGNHGIHASGGGAVSMAIAGSTSARGASDAIRAEATGSSAIDIDIDGGTHTTTGAQGASSAVVNLIGGSGTITLDIASGATVGSNSALTRRAVRLSTMGATTTTNAGTSIYGVFMGGAGADNFMNSGVFGGSFSLGGGNDAITNSASGTMTLTANSDFGAGNEDSLVNQGTLVIDHAANRNSQINIMGLERFTQTSGTLRFRIDFTTRPTGSANAILNIGDAAVVFTAGTVEIMVVGGSAPTSGDSIPLIRGTRIMGDTDLGSLRLASGVSGDLGAAGGILLITFPAPPPVNPNPTPTPNPNPTPTQPPSPPTPLTPEEAERAGFMAALEGYEALLQTGWHADRSFGQSLRSQSCDGYLVGDRRWCVWGDTGGRFTSHAPSGGADYDETVYALTMGAHLARGGWFMTAGGAFERSALEASSASVSVKAESGVNRILGGARIGSRGGRFPWGVDLEAQLRVGYSLQSTETDFGGNFTTSESSSNLLTVSASGGVEKRSLIGAGRMGLPEWLGDVSLTSYGELGVVSRSLSAFSVMRDASALEVSSASGATGFGRLSIEARTAHETRYGYVMPHLGAGIDFFLGDPAVSMEGRSGGTPPYSADGSQAPALMDIGFGGSYRRGDLELDFSYEGSFALTGETNLHNLVFRLNYAF